MDNDEVAGIYTAMLQARPIPADDAVERVAKALCEAWNAQLNYPAPAYVGGSEELRDSFRIQATAALYAIGYSALRKRVEDLENMLQTAADSLEVALEPWRGAAKVRGTKFIAELRAALHHPSVSGEPAAHL
jgi:hypothetical protein